MKDLLDTMTDLSEVNESRHLSHPITARKDLPFLESANAHDQSEANKSTSYVATHHCSVKDVISCDTVHQVKVIASLQWLIRPGE